MSEVVIDTNVWVLADRITSDTEGVPGDEASCIETCYQWLATFGDSDDQLVVDYSYRILREYRDNIRLGGVSESLLNELESRVLERLIFVDVEFDSNNHANLPFPISFDDPSDRKFIAAAISREPYAPIFNASETDWSKEKDRLSQNGITVNELCPQYISERLRER